MYGSMRTSAAGMQASRSWLDATAHNLANVNTTGYLQRQPVFAELAYAQWLESPARQAHRAWPERQTVEMSRGHGARESRSSFSDAAGALQHTGVPTEMAIQGEGFFVLGDVEAQVQGYTRDGNFRFDGEGYLVHASWHYLLNTEGERLQLPEGVTTGSISIDEVGVLRLPPVTDEEEGQILGQVGTALRAAGQRLRVLGENLYSFRGADGLEAEAELRAPGSEGTGIIRQGYLEQSNVDLAQEMLHLILAQRAFQLNSRTFQTSDEMFQMANQLRG